MPLSLVGIPMLAPLVVLLVGVSLVPSAALFLLFSMLMYGLAIVGPMRLAELSGIPLWSGGAIVSIGLFGMAWRNYPLADIYGNSYPNNLVLWIIAVAFFATWVTIFFVWSWSKTAIALYRAYDRLTDLVEANATAAVMRERFQNLADYYPQTMHDTIKDLAVNLYWPVMRKPPELPTLPPLKNGPPDTEALTFIREAEKRIQYLTDPKAWELYDAAITTSLKSYAQHLKGRVGFGPYTSRTIDLLDDVSQTVYDLHNPFLKGGPDVAGPIFAPIQHRWYGTITNATKEMPYGEKRAQNGEYVTYADYGKEKGRSKLLKNMLLSEFRPLFDTTTPVGIPDDIRFAHQWVLGSPRRGKTTLLSMMIADDLKRVAEGKLSLVVMDSQTKLIETIAHIKDFAPQEPMWKRLIWLRPDVEWPVAINPFHLGETDGLTATQRNALMNGSLEAIAYIFANLKTAVPTERMDFIVKKLARLCFVIPEANVFTFKKLLQKGGLKEFEKHIAALPDNEQDFYRDFMENEASWKETTQAVYWRVEDMLSYPMFREMFSAMQTKLNLYEELSKGRVILIDTSNKFFGDEGTEAYGRMWIALLYRAAQLRAEEEYALPTFVYIDEAHEYIARDIRFKRMLQKVRKQNVGLIIAHQYLSDITDEQVRSAVMNVDVKMVGGVSQADAATIARNMGSTSAQELTTLPSFTFAAHVKDDTFPNHAFPITAQPDAFNEYAKANNRDMENLTNVMRHRYHDHRPTKARPSAKTNFEKEGEGRPKNAREPGSASDDDTTGPSASWGTT
ncbi:MAG: ATP-binding protein [Bauldia sp.]|nr:ATP-binding protein [Bauldia sp.]